MSGTVGLVGFVENIHTEVNNHVSKVDLFVRGETKLLDFKCLTTGESGNSAHDFFDVSTLETVVPRCTHLTVHHLDVFHCVWAIVRGNGA